MWFDPAVVEAVRDAVPSWLGVIMVVLSYLGSVYLIAPTLIAAYWANRDLVAPWLGGVIGCYGLMSLTKSYHTASRPIVGPPVGAEDFPGWFVPWYEHAAHISTTSFPSGHAMAATIIIGLIVVDLPVSTLRRRAVAGIAAIGWVGFTRVGLAVHFPGDVAGGIAYGLAFLTLLYLARRTVSRRTTVDEATAAFAVGFAVALIAVAAVGSRNAHIVFGGSVGGLLAWYYAPTIAAAMRASIWEYLVPLLGVAVVVGTWVVTDLGIGNRAFIVCWSALFLAAIVLVPWVAPTDECWTTAKRRSRQIAG
ncbi:phosphatase PAP2 family protein [Natronorubrum sp. JWXQ-INN-674]|uniref:Phosphatase PAP2 family protein n=1 Tax=Natronorubrum halalkaliphilum TaxID=2691917 RepID=A0A6B0VH15_9EURY|nr:phosphatase PAP2 family protein [Natronorubrum halalkaliphilum]MXV61111.1 phosphatase PAP2 family protein [Natronorubrum halalkaliphilum]